VNVLALYHNMKRRGVRLEADGGRLLVDAPAGELTGGDRAALAEVKPALLTFLTEEEEPRTDGRRFDARPSKHPGYTSLYDPAHDEWHDFPTWDCYPSVVELATRNGEGEARRGAREEGAARRSEPEDPQSLPRPGHAGSGVLL
jgi:hypothetical protein